MLTPLDQLINLMTNLDKRIAKINKKKFLEDMITLATDEAMLLHMHQGLLSHCSIEDDDDEENSQEERKKQE